MDIWFLWLCRSVRSHQITYFLTQMLACVLPLQHSWFFWGVALERVQKEVDYFVFSGKYLLYCCWFLPKLSTLSLTHMRCFVAEWQWCVTSAAKLCSVCVWVQCVCVPASLSCVVFRQSCLTTVQTDSLFHMSTHCRSPTHTHTCCIHIHSIMSSCFSACVMVH